MKSTRGQACRRACPPPSLYLAGPFSVGYVEFFTFLMPPCGLSLRLDVSKIGAPVGARSILALLLSNNIAVLMGTFDIRQYERQRVGRAESGHWAKADRLPLRSYGNIKSLSA